MTSFLIQVDWVNMFNTQLRLLTDIGMSVSESKKLTLDEWYITVQYAEEYVKSKIQGTE